MFIAPTIFGDGTVTSPTDGFGDRVRLCTAPRSDERRPNHPPRSSKI